MCCVIRTFEDTLELTVKYQWNSISESRQFEICCFLHFWLHPNSFFFPLFFRCVFIPKMKGKGRGKNNREKEDEGKYEKIDVGLCELGVRRLPSAASLPASQPVPNPIHLPARPTQPQQLISSSLSLYWKQRRKKKNDIGIKFSSGSGFLLFNPSITFFPNKTGFVRLMYIEGSADLDRRPSKSSQLAADTKHTTGNGWLFTLQQ